MVFISHLKLRNFKSFKAADIQLPKTFICFAGPNGSGKSNLCDAIRFVMGEKSLRSLRAKKVKDLIHTGAKSAEVTLIFDSEEDNTGYEIKRAIREDGKIRYRLNGKKTTRSAILEALKRHNLDESGRNTIAQGEVQRIINMNGKERRTIIDSVAGIADFEQKKSESLNELRMVDDRIKEGKLILGERHSFLEELGREREGAIRYTEAKKDLTNAKGTLLKVEINRLEAEVSEAESSKEKLCENKIELDQKVSKIDEEIAVVDNERAKASAEIQSKQKTNAMIRKLEELKASCGSKKQLIADREDFIKRVNEECKTTQEEVSHEATTIEKLEKELQKLRNDLKKAEDELRLQGGFSEDSEITKMRKSIDESERALSTLREKIVFLTSEIDAKRQLIDAKEGEMAAIKVEDGAEDEEEDRNSLGREVDKIAKEIDSSFARTREINNTINELDKQMLELKEKASIYRLRSSPQLANPALAFINDIKGKTPGIYGTIADLITFDAKYSSAVEAAAGSRLMYVVVESIDTATEVIEKLKKAKAGRATFIPLNSIRTPQAAKAGRFSSVIDVIDFKEEIRRAADYIFADTLLVDEIGDAKKLGVGSARMVTLDGEIFERSGIVSGGRAQSGLLNANQTRKIEEELNEIKSTKDALIQELYSIREEESKMRAEKSQVEIKIKTIEMKEKLGYERRKERQKLIERRTQLETEVEQLALSIKEKAQEKNEEESKIANQLKVIAERRKALELAEAEFRKLTKESSDKRAQLSANLSSINATIEGKLNELELRNHDNKAKNDRLSNLRSEEKETVTKLIEIAKQLKEDEKEILLVEERISSTSKEIEKLFEEMKSYENEFQELGKRRGQVRMDIERLGKELNQIEIKKATSGTRLEDMNAEFSAYGSAEFLKLEREELTKIIGQSERILANLGNVNMAAIEMYDKKKAEIDEVGSKIEKLEQEREAILSMISEIDEHKKEAFFEAFNSISENFKKMFDYVNVGSGHLSLSDAIDPFQSGLFIKLRRNNQEHALDALSGGEKTLVALMFIFALQLFKPAPFYILDEVDAALDKANSKNLAELVTKMSRDSQFIVVSHNDTVMSNSETVIGVAKSESTSKLVGIKLKQAITEVVS